MRLEILAIPGNPAISAIPGNPDIPDIPDNPDIPAIPEYPDYIKRISASSFWALTLYLYFFSL